MLIQLKQQASSEKERLSKLISEIGSELSIILTERDDLAVILTKRIEDLSEQLQMLDRQVAVVNRQLSEFDASGRVLERLFRIARTRREIEHIESVSENQSFIELKGIRQECEQYVEDVELLMQALRYVIRADAEKRLAKAQTAISTIFTTLTDRPDFPGLRVSPSKDGYVVQVTSSSSLQEALPILNQGDLNCAALSIFLALATTDDTSHELSFVILDDPSQNLDETGKKNLCKVIGGVCDSRQLVIATADDQLRDEVLKITKTKKYYVLAGWDPTNGPQIELRDI